MSASTSIPQINAEERGLKHRELTEKLEVGLLFNLGSKSDFKRLVFENERKIRVSPRASAELK